MQHNREAQQISLRILSFVTAFFVLLVGTAAFNTVSDKLYKILIQGGSWKTILKRMGRMTKYLRENDRNKITVML